MSAARRARARAGPVLLSLAAALALMGSAPARMRRSATGLPAARDSLLLKSYVRTLASVRWEGRGVGTAGIDSAADWIAARMRAAGLRPGGEGSSWFEPFEVTTGVVAESPCELRAGAERYVLGDSLQPLGFSSNGSAHARVVFAGYGITAPGYQWDDYAGLDAHDALVLVLTQEPGEMDSTSRFDGAINTPFADLRTKAINAARSGCWWRTGRAGTPASRRGPPRATARAT